MTRTELSSGRPRRRVLAGERMVTPVKPLELGERGRGEELLPGRDRLAPDHWAVREPRMVPALRPQGRRYGLKP
jgi:hypothetical protein